MEQENKELVIQDSKPKPATVHADDKGLLVGGTLDEQWRLATAYLKSGLMPAALNTPEKILVATQFARELGLPPVTAMRQIYVINGTPALFGDLPLSLVMKSGQLEDIVEEIELDEHGEPFRATCKVKRRYVNSWVIRTFTMEDAKRAGLLSRKGPWQTYPKRMLQCRARAWALKDLFPDMLSGSAIAEFDYDTLPESGHNEPVVHNDRRSSLNDKFLPEPEKEFTDMQTHSID